MLIENIKKIDLIIINNIKVINTILLIFISIFGFLFSKSIILRDKELLYSFLYVALMLFSLVLMVVQVNSKRINLNFILLIYLAICLPILIGFLYYNGSEKLLWPDDAYSQHLPMAMNVVKMFKGEIPFYIYNKGNLWNRVYLSSFYTGSFFYFFGVSPFVSSISMVFLKCINVFLLFKVCEKYFNKNIALYSCLIYVLSPTLLYYNLQFYKEIFVQFLILLFLFFLSKDKTIYYILSSIVLALIGVERFYLLPLLVVGIYFYFSRIFQFQRRTHFFLVSVLCIFLLLFFKFYFGGFSLDFIINQFKLSKGLYASGDSNVTKNIGYPLDFIRILFTPWFNKFKLETMRNYDSLLIWGSFYNQIIILIFLFGLYKNRKSKLFPICYSFLLFLLLFAYIGPFNGRVRDSFYPLICIFGGAGIYSLRFRDEHVIKKFI